MAARNDELGGRFVLAGPLALGRDAPGSHRNTATAGAAAERMIDRIHRLAANVTAPAEPARAPGLADRNVHVVGIRYRSDGGHAAAMDQALLVRIKPQDHILAVAADDLR